MPTAVNYAHVQHYVNAFVAYLVLEASHRYGEYQLPENYHRKQATLMNLVLFTPIHFLNLDVFARTFFNWQNALHELVLLVRVLMQLLLR